MDIDYDLVADWTFRGLQQPALGATSLAYLSLEGAQEATRRPENEFCRACFTRNYPTPVPAGRQLAKFRVEPTRN